MRSPVTLLHEIQEQPDLFRSVLAQAEQRFARLTFPSQENHSLLGIAEGSSKHVLEIAAPFIETWTGLPVWVQNPAAIHQKFAISKLFETRQPIPASLFRYCYLLVLSQSGETGSILNVLEALDGHFTEAGRERPALLTVTNREQSTLADTYGNHLFIGAGEEKSIAATKTMTTSLFTLLVWGLTCARQMERISADLYQTIWRQFEALPQKVEALLEPAQLEAIFQFTRKLIEVNHFILLSKGPLVLSLPETGLKLIETSKNIVYTDNSESFKHGPKVMLSGVNDEHPNCIYIVPNNPELADAFFKDIRSHFWQSNDELAFENDRVFFVTFKNSPPIPDEIKTGLRISNDKILTLPEASEFEALILTLITFQLVSYYLAVLKGENPDNPALEKAVVE